MSKLNDIKKRAKAAGKRADQTATTKGGGDFEAPAEGSTVMRFIEYIELGVQKGGMYKGKPKKPSAKVQLAFELLGKKHLREVEVEGKTEVKGTYFRLFPSLPLSLNEKAKFKKLFNLMTKSYDNADEITHMSQMLGDAFAGKIRNNEVGTGADKKTYSNLTDDTGNYMVSAPVREELDEDGEVISVKKLKVPECTMHVKLFLWDDPTREDWEALDEKTQERIKSAENYEGSPVQLMLEGGDSIDVGVADEEPDEDDVEEDEVKPAKKSKVKAVVDEDEDDTDEDEDAEDEDEEAEDDEEEVAPKKAGKKSKPAVKKAAPTKSKSKATAKTAKSPSKSKLAEDLEDLIDDED